MPDDVGAEWRRFPVGVSAPLADVARTGAPLFLESRAEWGERYPDMAVLLERAGHHANAVLPLVVEGRVPGGLGAAVGAPKSFTVDDRALTLAVAQQCAQRSEEHTSELQSRQYL